MVDLLWKSSGRTSNTNNLTHGLDLIKLVRERTRSYYFPPVIIVLTGYGQPQILSQCYSLGIDFVVIKHFHKKALHSSLDIESKVVYLWLILWYMHILDLLYRHLKVPMCKLHPSKIKFCISKALSINTEWTDDELLRVPYSLRRLLKKLDDFLKILELQCIDSRFFEEYPKYRKSYEDFLTKMGIHQNRYGWRFTIR